MRLVLAQELEPVRGEIDHEQATARRDEAGRLAERPRRIVEVVQNLMDQDEVEAVRAGTAAHRCRPAAARRGCRPARSRLARATASMAWLASRPSARAGARGQQLQHPPGPGAEVEQRADRPFAPSASRIAASTASSETCSERSRSHSGASRAKKRLRRSRRAAPAPPRAARDRPVEAASVAVERVRAPERTNPAAALWSASRKNAHAPSRCRSTEPRLDEQLEMARDARLRLAQDVGQIGDRQLALGSSARTRSRVCSAAARSVAKASGQVGTGQSQRGNRMRHKDMFICCEGGSQAGSCASCALYFRQACRALLREVVEGALETFQGSISASRQSDESRASAVQELRTELIPEKRLVLAGFRRLLVLARSASFAGRQAGSAGYPRLCGERPLPRTVRFRARGDGVGFTHERV